jgi:hypothetical protein
VTNDVILLGFDLKGSGFSFEDLEAVLTALTFFGSGSIVFIVSDFCAGFLITLGCGITVSVLTG